MVWFRFGLGWVGCGVCLADGFGLVGVGVLYSAQFWVGFGVLRVREKLIMGEPLNPKAPSPQTPQALPHLCLVFVVPLEHDRPPHAHLTPGDGTFPGGEALFGGLGLADPPRCGGCLRPQSPNPYRPKPFETLGKHMTKTRLAWGVVCLRACTAFPKRPPISPRSWGGGRPPFGVDRCLGVGGGGL